MQLRPYQQTLHNEVHAAWALGFNCVLIVLPTGGGKSVTLAHVVHAHQGAAVVMAHRAELVAQLSLALAREGVRHRVIGPPALGRLCVTAHMEELRTNYVDPNARVGVASVQSVASYKDVGGWFAQVTLAVGDEFHHYCRENQFGKAMSLFPNARMLGVTATPLRADGKGLGRAADGFVDHMVVGPTMRELIEAGHLSRYRVFAPPSNLDRSAIPVGASGDFSAKVLHDVTKRSTVLGDVVQHYCKHAPGKLGLTFADSIGNATDIARRFREAGVPAEVLTGKTDGMVRAQVLRRFRERLVLQIVSVALIDEGFDCPAVEVVSDAAATESYGRFAQRFGRGLRVLAGKTHMLYFDHVGNVLRHGLPDAPREWSLNRRERRSSVKVQDEIPLRVCTECCGAYEAFRKACPYCGHQHVPMGRSAPEQVDGDLVEMTGTPWMAATVARVGVIDGPPAMLPHLAPIAAAGARNTHLERQVAQAGLRSTMQLWAGWKAAQGHDDSEAYKLFYFRYGLDAMTAKTLGRPDAEALRERIQKELDDNGIRDYNNQT